MSRGVVLCSGRCGSTTFGAAAHCTNSTSGQESQDHRIGPTRLDYPDQHSEIDNRLSWMLGKVEQTFGDAPCYVHLLRDPEAVARSFAVRQKFGLMKAYRERILLKHFSRSPDVPILDVARDLLDTITSNISGFLQTKSKVMTMHVETMEADFPRFWDWIGATGDLTAATAEWGTLHNATRGA